jgi:hypothetical protein
MLLTNFGSQESQEIVQKIMQYLQPSYDPTRTRAELAPASDHSQQPPNDATQLLHMCCCCTASQARAGVTDENS